MRTIHFLDFVDGNTFEALQKIRWLYEDVSWIEPGETPNPEWFIRFEKALSEFHTFFENDRWFISNYGECYRYGECMSTVFAAVNEVFSRRMVKKQQMRWT